MKSQVKQNAGKMPAFQFYPGDWRKDPGVQALDYETRGIWLEILCLMHESDERGVLLLNGRLMPLEALARLLGLTNSKLNKHLAKLLAHGVIRQREGDGALYSKRMVADEHLRQIRQEAGREGGLAFSPSQAKAKQNTKQNHPPSSSSSISVSSSPPTSINNTPHSPPQGAGGVVGGFGLETLPDDPDDTDALHSIDISQAARHPAHDSPDPETSSPASSSPDPRYADILQAYQETWKEEFFDHYPYQKADGTRLATFLQTSQLDLDQFMTAVTWCWDQIRENGHAAWAVKQALTLRGFCANYPAIFAEYLNTEAKTRQSKR